MLFLYLDFVNNVAVNMGLQLSLKILFAYSSDIYPEMELLDHMVLLFLIFWGVSIVFFIVAEPTYIPINNIRVPFSLSQHFSGNSFASFCLNQSLWPVCHDRAELDMAFRIMKRSQDLERHVVQNVKEFWVPCMDFQSKVLEIDWEISSSIKRGCAIFGDGLV